MEQSGIGIAYRLKREDERRLIEWLRAGGAVGETVELTVTDNLNRFDLGTAIARIESWKGPSRKL